MTKVLYPGSFDPITKGHMNIIEQASSLFDEVVVAILVNSAKKNTMFTMEEREDMIKEIYHQHKNIKVVSSTGTATDLAMLHGCKAILRGLRNFIDFNYELGLAQLTSDFSDDHIKTVFLLAGLSYQYVSSSMVKEVLNLNKDITNYVDPLVKEKMLVKRGVDYG